MLSARMPAFEAPGQKLLPKPLRRSTGIYEMQTLFAEVDCTLFVGSVLFVQRLLEAD